MVMHGDDTPGGYAAQRWPSGGRGGGLAVHSARMDPLDHARPDPDGATCAVCEGPVPAASVHLLARREDLAFVQVDCGACRSTTLAFVLAADGHATHAAPVTGDDVLDMHDLLSGWHGGLRELLASEPGRPSAAS